MADPLLQIQGHETRKGDDPKRPPWIRVRLSADPEVERTRDLMLLYLVDIPRNTATLNSISILFTKIVSVT